MAKRKRSAAQKAATRRLVAANRSRRRRKNPIMSFGSRPATKAFRGRRRRNPLTAARGKSARNTGVRYVGSGVVRRRRNPVGGRMGVMNMLKQASMAAAGALVLDAAWSYLPIPVGMKVGGVKHVAKGAGAIVMGMLIGKVLNKATAEKMTLGALTVIVHSAARDLLATAVPTLHLDGMGYYSPGMVVGGGVMGNGMMGEYVSQLPAPGMAGMGQYMNADQRAMAMDGMNYYG